jgi:hypothetical protein
VKSPLEPIASIKVLDVKTKQTTVIHVGINTQLLNVLCGKVVEMRCNRADILDGLLVFVAARPEKKPAKRRRKAVPSGN